MNDPNPRPLVGLSHLETFDRAHFSDFERQVAADGLHVRIETRPPPGAHEGLEWLIPTAVVVYISKAYFEAFLKEAGKDHYAILKGAILKLSAKFTGKGAPTGRLMFSKGKAASDLPEYSVVYSLVADLGDGFSAKLLLGQEFDASTCNEAQEVFLEFLGNLYDGHVDPDKIQGIADAKPMGHMLLLGYDPKTQRLEVIDPRSHHIKPR